MPKFASKFCNQVVEHPPHNWADDDDVFTCNGIRTVKLIDGRASQRQVGGDHYKQMGIDPFSYALSNNLGFLEGTIIKYVSRWRQKNGLEDLEKAKHTLEVLIEHVKDEEFRG